MRLGRAWLVVVAGCGRLGFENPDAIGTRDAGSDATTDAGVDELLRDCELHLTVAETAWTGAANEVTTDCGTITGTALGGAHVVEDATRGRVAELVGDPSCIDFASPPTLEPTTELTMSAWFLSTVDGLEPHGIISKRTAFQVESQYTLYLHDQSKIWVDINDDADRFSSIAAITIGAWQQVTVVYDGGRPPNSRTSIYLDGQLDQVSFDGESSIASLGSRFVIGCLPDGSVDQSFVGRLDDVAVWRRALDETEVTAWYERTR